MEKLEKLEVFNITYDPKQMLVSNMVDDVTYEFNIHYFITYKNVAKTREIPNTEGGFLQDLSPVPSIGSYMVYTKGKYSITDKTLSLEEVNGGLIVNLNINNINNDITYDLIIADLKDNKSLENQWILENTNDDFIAKVISGPINALITSKHAKYITDKLHSGIGIDGVLNKLKESKSFTEHLEFMVTGDNTGIGLIPKTDLGFYLLPLIGQVTNDTNTDGNPGLMAMLKKITEAANKNLIKDENESIIINQEVIDAMNKSVDEVYPELVQNI